MFKSIKKFFAPAPHRERLPAGQIDRKYRRCRIQILESTFMGYAMFYLCRNSLSAVAKEMGPALEYSHAMIGNILACTAIAYGIGKFLMGSLSDRSNPRKFMATGLFLTACLNFAFGSSTNYTMHMLLWALNGLVQGMGWPPCGRSIGHWYGVHERGAVFAVWNIAHNVGGGIAGIIAASAAARFGWQSAFYVPGAICLVGSLYLLWRLRDTPQSEGLPPIEAYHNDYTDDELAHGKDTHEAELSTRELFVDNILKNRLLWVFAAANFFVYIVRYSMLDWGPLYLSEVKGANLEDGGLAILMVNFGGIPSTLLLGWLSDRVGGRRGLVSLACMFPIVLAFMAILWNPPGRLAVDMAALAVIGFFIYPPVMLLGVAALDLTSKKAVGTAAGFIGLFGYIGRTAQAKGFGWMADHFSATHGQVEAWNFVIWSIIACTLVAIVLLFFTRNVRPRG
ncbi:MAG: MFS transporter, partial [Verrucomicrobiota bacterium]